MMVSVIICSYYVNRTKQVELLVKDIESQIPQYKHEIIVVKNVSPVGKARNIGIKKAKGDIIIFLDDDVKLGKNTIKNLIKGVKKYGLSIVGGSHIIPKNANFVQRWIAREIPREEVKIVNKDIESDLIGTACWANKKKIYDTIGYFNENVTAGEDTEMREKARKNGIKTILLKNTYVFHAVRDNLFDFFKQRFWYGKGIGQMRRSPRTISNIFGIVYGTFRFCFILFHVFLPKLNLYIKKKERSPFGFKPLYAFGDFFYVLGYIRGINERL